MSTQVQFRRGSTTQNNAFTGAAGEITYDTDVKTLRIHDGTTAGGGATVLTTTATQTVLNKTHSTGSVWAGGLIATSYGGTGRNITPAAGGILYSTATNFNLSNSGTSGQVLISGGDSAPSWVASTSLQAGNSVNSTYATNIAGGSAGQLLIQQDASLTTFITAGDAGTFLKSNGAGYAPGWSAGQVTYGSTTVAFGQTSTSIAGLTAIDATVGATSFFATPSGTVSLLGSAVSLTLGNNATAVSIGKDAGATLTVRPGTVVGVNTTQTLYNTVATTVNAFGAATTISAGASTGTFTVNNAAFVHNSTGATKVAVGTIAQRPTGAVGLIRYNSEISSYEGYASGNWSSLGGVKSVDAFTYIQAETSAGASNGDLDFFAENAAGTAAQQVGQWNRTNLKDYTGTIVGTQTTQNVFNATATTINLGGAATTLSIGAATGTATINNTTLAAKAITASTTLGVTGATTLSTLSATSGTFSTTLGVTGATTLSSTLGVTGATTLSSTLSAGASTLASATITGAATVGTTLGVTGATTLAGLSATTGSFSSTLGVTGAATFSSTAAVTGDFSVATNKFTVAALSGNTAVAGTLGVTGATTLSSTLGVTGLITSTAGISGGPATHTTGSFSSTLGVTGATTLSSTLGVTGATTLSSTLGVSGVTSLTNNTASSSTGTGALVVTGGVGIGGTVYVGGTLNVAGNLSVTGTTTTTNSQSLTVTTPQLFLASDNAANSTDVGLLGGYTVATVARKTGLVKQASSGEWRLFSNTTAAPGTTYDFTGVVYDTLRLGTAILTDTTASSSTTTGALRVSGGAGIAGAAYVGGVLNVAGATTLSSALTYGGVALSNAVTGTGNMVLSTSPTITGTLAAANITASGTLGVTGATTLAGLSATTGTFSSTLGVTGTSTFTGAITANGGVTGALTGNATTATTLQTARTINGASFNGSANISFTTDATAEGTSNLYFTTARARSSVSATGSIAYNSTTGVFSFTQGNTDTISEGSTNLYFTNARARAAHSFAAGSGAYNSTTGVITIPTATSQLTNDAGFLTAGSASSGNTSGYAKYLSGADAYTTGTDGWFRSNGNAGWYSQTYAVGIYANQAGWVQTYNSAGMLANAFQIASDERLKENIKDSDYGLSTVLQLRSVQYDKKADGKHDIGLIAQDVEKVIPEFVHEDAEGMKSVNYPQMVSVLIKAVQELSAEVNALKAKLGE